MIFSSPYRLEITFAALQPQNFHRSPASKLAKEMLKITKLKTCHFIFIFWTMKMVKAALLWGINVYLTNKLQRSSTSQQETSSMLTKSQSMSRSVNMGYRRKHSDLCVCSNFQIQSRTKKKKKQELCNSNTSPCCQHWQQGSWNTRSHF